MILSYCPTGKLPNDYGPFLKGDHDRVRLREVDVPGVVAPLRAFAPEKQLQPHLRYELRFAKQPTYRYVNEVAWSSGDAPDFSPPRWSHPPIVSYAGASQSLGHEYAEVILKIPAADNEGPVAVLMELGPGEPEIGAIPLMTSRKLLKAKSIAGEAHGYLNLQSGGECSSLRLPSRESFRARLAVIDGAGNVSPMPGEPLRFRIPQLRPEATYAVTTVVPRSPVLLQKVEPKWPELAKKARVQGVVAGELSIAPDGDVKEVNVTDGVSFLSEATVVALKQWRFAPAPDAALSRKISFRTHFLEIQPEYQPDWNP